MNDRSPFRFLQKIQNSEPLSEEELKDFNLFLMQKAFYYAPGNERLANITNNLWNVPKPLQYKMLCAIFKGKKSQWIKKERKEKDVSEIMQKYGCSKKTALEYEVIWEK